MHNVLLALQKVVEQIPDVLYLIAGDGKERKRLESFCVDLGLRNHVYFLGNIEHNQLPPIYCAADLFVLTPHEETFGISFLEASACGKPVIGGRCGGITDAVIDGETGLLVDVQNVNEITEAIVCLLKDKDLAWRLGENGRRRVARELTWEKVGERFIKFVQDIV